MDALIRLYLEGMISEQELKASVPYGQQRIEIKPAVILLWDFGTKSYIKRWNVTVGINSTWRETS